MDFGTGFARSARKLKIQPSEGPMPDLEARLDCATEPLRALSQLPPDTQVPASWLVGVVEEHLRLLHEAAGRFLTIRCCVPLATGGALPPPRPEHAIFAPSAATFIYAEDDVVIERDDAGLWRCRFGEKGVNLVIAHERRPGGPVFLDWWEGGQRHRQSIATRCGLRRALYVHSDVKQIKQLVKEISRDLLRGFHDELGAARSYSVPHSLQELLDTYHTSNTDWKPSHSRHQEILRDWWLKRLHPQTDIRVLSSMIDGIEGAVRRADWSPRTQQKYLKYLKAAMSFAQLKKKWIGEQHSLSALNMPSPDPQAEAYATDEISRLLVAGAEIDLRCEVAMHLAYQALRRVDAILHLRVSDVRISPESSAIALRFASEHDKVGRKGVAWVAGDRAYNAIQALLQTPAVRASGLLFPAGPLSDRTKDRKPIRYEIARDWLLAAETAAQVEHLPGRGWHAFKRRGATDAYRLDMAAASHQAGTTEETLRTIYVQHDDGPKLALANALAGKVSNGDNGKGASEPR
jgi:hypothetical protein